MPLKKSFLVLIEGYYDKEFFEHIIKPLLLKKFKDYEFHFIKHRHKSNEDIKKYIYSFKEFNSKIIYVEDFDKGPCFTFKREKIKEKFEELKNENIIIVKLEIESWYLAGTNDKIFKDRIDLKKIISTDNISKGLFEEYIPNNLTKKEFILELMKFFDIKRAKERNKSFSYFITKWDL